MLCRICRAMIVDTCILSLTNMPSSAQNFPTKETLSFDKGSDLEVYQCSDCGLVQLTNDPVDYYCDVIRASAYSDEMKLFRIDQFHALVQKYNLYGKKVLEVGCGKGEYLSLLISTGFDAYGVENAKESVLYCINNHYRVYEGFLGESNLMIKDAPFDAFVCFNFMEHWPDPRSTLSAIRENLSDGAIGLIEVPNFDMILEKGLFSEFIADHLLYFTESTLKYTLQSNGFDVLECSPVWNNYILSAVVRKRSPLNLDFFNRFRIDISEQLHSYINQFPEGKVAVWGAGHQALAVIALANIQDRICYVVDSAPFKQGKYTPASHLPIVSPDELISNSVDAVIVMAASYSDEVANTLRLKYPADLEIAILRDYGLEIYA